MNKAFDLKLLRSSQRGKCSKFRELGNRSLNKLPLLETFHNLIPGV